MNNYKSILFYCFSIVIIIAFSACNEECYDETNPLCENFNPCWDKVETDASFMVSQKSFTEDYIDGDVVYFPLDTFISDTLLLGIPVYFDANDHDAESYKWTVGTDVRVWEEEKFYLDFDKNDASLIGVPLPVQLVTTRNPYPDCFEGDDGIDTIQKNIHFVDRKDALYFGTWEGYINDNINDKYQIKIYWSELGGDLYVHFENLFNVGCISEVIGSNNYFGYKEARIGATLDDDWDICSPNAYYIASRIKVNVTTSEGTHDLLEMKWYQIKTIIPSNGPVIDETGDVTFTGHRIQ